MVPSLMLLRATNFLGDNVLSNEAMRKDTWPRHTVMGNYSIDDCVSL